jgi:hypothetical protein
MFAANASKRARTGLTMPFIDDAAQRRLLQCNVSEI